MEISAFMRYTAIHVCRLHHEKKHVPMRKPGLGYDATGRPIEDGPQRPIGLARAEDALRQLVFANQVRAAFYTLG